MLMVYIGNDRAMALIRVSCWALENNFPFEVWSLDQTLSLTARTVVRLLRHIYKGCPKKRL